MIRDVLRVLPRTVFGGRKPIDEHIDQYWYRARQTDEHVSKTAPSIASVEKIDEAAAAGYPQLLLS